MELEGGECEEVYRVIDEGGLGLQIDARAVNMSHGDEL